MAEEARRALLKAHDFLERTSNHLWCYICKHYLGEIFFDVGDYHHAEGYYGDVLQDEDSTHEWPSFMDLMKLAGVRAAILGGDKEFGIEKCRRNVNENKVKLYEGWKRRYLGEILMNLSEAHCSEAQHWIEQAIEAKDRQGMRFELARCYDLYAKLFKRKGDIFNAKQQLGKAIDIYKKCGADGWVTKAEEKLARLS